MSVPQDVDNELYNTLPQSASRGRVSAEAACHTLFTIAGEEYKNPLYPHLRGREASYDALVTISQHSELSRSQEVCPTIIEHASGVPKEFVQMLISRFKGRANHIMSVHSLLQLYTPKSPTSSRGLTRAGICDDTLSQG